MDKLVYWIWLSLACTPGSSTFQKLLSRFDDAREIFDADDDSIASAVGSRSKDYTALLDKDLTQAKIYYDFCMEKHVGILTYEDDAFPESLRNIPTPPVLLYYRGKLPDFDAAYPIAVVGTRRLTEYGRRNAFHISYDLARSGAMIVSGMAIGIDSVAHAGALAANGITVAVIGSGIDVCYPKDHLPLAREIVKAGCVLTEFHPGARPDKQNFPVRNRLISGLSKLTLVVEGRERSGALLTARHAKEQGRPVYAVPGNVGSPHSELTNLLIRNGAKICTRADDIVHDFFETSMGKLNPFELAKPAPVDMMLTLSTLKISCVAVNDAIFRPTRSGTVRQQTNQQQNPKPTQQEDAPQSSPQAFDSIDATAIRIYKNIPVGEECSIESLVRDDLPMREVMKGLLKLELGKFILVLPGERVRRNF